MPAHDAPRRAVFVLAGLLVLVACAIGGVTWLLRPSFTGRPQAAAVASDGNDRTGAAALQPAPQSDLAAYQAGKQAELAATGPEPHAPGYARIPVQRAMALMSEQGLRADAAPRGAAP